MNLSAKIIYAFKAVTDLALRYGQTDPIKISDIAERQKIPKKFLTQILIQLKNSGIVSSSRGIAGGYYLLKRPEDLSLAEVIKAVDESVFFDVSSIDKKHASPETDILYDIWGNISANLEKEVEEVTYDKIVSKLNNNLNMYHI